MPQKLPLDDIGTFPLAADMVEHSELGLERWRYEDEEVIIAEGEQARELFVLEEGAVRIERKGTGAEGEEARSRYLAISMAEEGKVHTFGEMAFFLEGRRTATVKSVGASQVIRVSEEGIPRLFQHFPQLALELFRDLVGKLRQTTEELGNLQDLVELGAQQRVVGPQDSLLGTPGEVPEHLFQVVSGRVTLTDSEGNTREVMEEDALRGLVNLEEFLCRRPAAHRAEASPGTILLAIPHSCAQAVLRHFPDAVIELLIKSSRR